MSLYDPPDDAFRTTMVGGSTTRADHPLDHEDDAIAPEQFGGIKWGASFFGWLVAVAMCVLLSALIAAGTAAWDKARGVPLPSASDQAGTMGIVAAAIAFAVLIVAYYAGGYVAGRMARFDGGRQGFGVWLVGLLMVAAGIALAMFLGPPHVRLPSGIHLPTLPIPTDTLSIRVGVTAGTALLCSLLTGIAGGRAGCRYHRKVDAAL
jgi:hypothetical protein